MCVETRRSRTKKTTVKGQSLVTEGRKDYYVGFGRVISTFGHFCITMDFGNKKELKNRGLKMVVF